MLVEAVAVRGIPQQVAQVAQAVAVLEELTAVRQLLVQPIQAVLVVAVQAKLVQVVQAVMVVQDL
jgi:hypothetical protein